jgi:hypothetical protein
LSDCRSTSGSGVGASRIWLGGARLLAAQVPGAGLDTCSVPQQLVMAGNVRKPEVDRAIEFVVEVANVLSRPT